MPTTKPHVFLPVEIYNLIIEHLEYAADVNALGQTCHYLHNITIQRLYPYFSQRYSPHGIKRLVEHRNIASLQQLLSLGFEIERYDGTFSDHRTPFELAVTKGYDEVIDVFLDRYRLDYTLDDIPCGTEVLSAAAREGRIDLLKILLGLRTSTPGLVDPGEKCINVALVEAADRSHLEAMEILLEAGANPNALDITEIEQEINRKPLYVAALKNHEAVVRLLLQKGAYLAVHGDINCSEIAEICQAGGEKMATLILENVDVESQLEILDDWARTYLLHYATAIGDERLVQRLLDLGCWVSPDDAPEQSPVGLAAMRGHWRVAELLIDDENGGRRSERRLGGYCHVLAKAAAQNNDQAMFEIAVKCAHAHRHSAADPPWSSYISLFEEVVRAGRESMSQQLIEQGVLEKVFRHKWFGHSFQAGFIIEAACVAGNWNLIEQILETSSHSKGEISYRKATEEVLVHTVKSGRLDWLPRIFPRLMRLDPDCSRCQKALAMAARSHQLEMMDYFLDNGFDVNEQYDAYHERKTLLSWALGKDAASSLSSVKALVDRGAEVDSQASYGYTVLAELALADGPTEVMRELLDRGADPSSGRKGISSALQFAIKKTDYEMVRLFLEALATRSNPSHGTDWLRYSLPEQQAFPPKKPSLKLRWWNAFLTVQSIKRYLSRAAYPVPS